MNESPPGPIQKLSENSQPRSEASKWKDGAFKAFLKNNTFLIVLYLYLFLSFSGSESSIMFATCMSGDWVVTVKQ